MQGVRPCFVWLDFVFFLLFGGAESKVEPRQLGRRVGTAKLAADFQFGWIRPTRNYRSHGIDNFVGMEEAFSFCFSFSVLVLLLLLLPSRRNGRNKKESAL